MKKCILICDDDKDILEVCRRIFEKRDYKVETSTDCESIFQNMKTINPDIILMDIWIPVMGGEKATIKLKTTEETRRIPVILFSAHKEIQNISHLVHADDFIQKPFELSDLLNKINKYISKSS